MKIALSLSGGGLRAAAHIGALKFLEERGVEISAVSGSSAGAMVALMIANGFDSAEIYGFLAQLRKRDIFRFASGPGIFSLGKLEEKLGEFVETRDYKSMKIPLFTCVTDMNSGESVYLDSGDAVENTIASSSLTPIFQPKQTGEKLYGDGGFSDNLPSEPLKKLGEKVLAIDVNPITGQNPSSFKALTIRSLLIMMHSNVRRSAEMSDAVIEIKGVSRMHLFKFSEMDNAYRSGYEELSAAWDDLKKKF